MGDVVAHSSSRLRKHRGGSGGKKKRERAAHASEEGRDQQITLAAVGCVAGYAALRSGIKLFHYARRSLLRGILSDVCPALTAAKATYWLDFGSLLGIHRDGDLILHDNDIDLSVLNPDWPSLMAHLQAALPQYNVKLETPSEAPDINFIRVYCALGFADIFGAVELSNGRVLVDCGHGETTSIAKDLVVPTQEIEWRNTKISVPRNLEGALEARYGTTWRVPRYMDKGADTVEGNKTYARIFRALSKLGIRL